jgi:hypothetical protein
MLEHEHSQHDFGRRPRPPLPITLWMALRKHLEHPVHKLGIVQSGIDTSKARLQKLTSGPMRAKCEQVVDRKLRSAAADHSFLDHTPI